MANDFRALMTGDPEHLQFRGPLAWVLAALDAARTPCLLTAPCDSPRLPMDYATLKHSIPA